MRTCSHGERSRTARHFVAAAGLALGLGASVYLVAREAGSSSLPGGLGLDPWPSLTGAVPALTFTLGFTLLAAAAWGPSRASLACSAGAWLAVSWAFELLQHPRVAMALLPHPAGPHTDTPFAGVTSILARHAHLGTFDPLDLAASAAGGVLALVVGTHALRSGAVRW